MPPRHCRECWPVRKAWRTCASTASCRGKSRCRARRRRRDPCWALATAIEALAQRSSAQDGLHSMLLMRHSPSSRRQPEVTAWARPVSGSSPPLPPVSTDRKSVGGGKGGSVWVGVGGGRMNKKKKKYGNK